MVSLYNFDCNALVGKIFIKVVDTGNELHFTEANGTEWVMYHGQDCCEIVYLAETIGDLADLVGTPILEFREDTSDVDEANPLPQDEYGNDAEQWTFYNIRTIKGSVTLRWFGSSNGYYSISVDWRRIDV